jgi:hypothetical protein
VHALRKGRAKLVLFDEVDLSLLVEKEVNGVPVHCRWSSAQSTKRVSPEFTTR